MGTENGTGYGVEIILTSGSSEQVWFGNAKLISICGYKLEDTDLDGVFELGQDAPVANWLIEIYGFDPKGVKLGLHSSTLHWRTAASAS